MWDDVSCLWRQAISRVSVDSDGESIKHCRECLLMPYTKSIVSAVLTLLVVVGVERPRILCVGLGGGSIPAFLSAMMPCDVDVVEVEPTVLEAAKDLGFQPDGMKLYLEDGAAFVTSVVQGADKDGVYDAVIVDAYDADGNVPVALTTSSAFTKAASAELALCIPSSVSSKP